MSSGTRKGRSERGGGKGGAEDGDGDGEPRPPQPVPPPPPPPPSLAACQCRVALGPKMAAASICLLSREGRGGGGGREAALRSGCRKYAGKEGEVRVGGRQAGACDADRVPNGAFPAGTDSWNSRIPAMRRMPFTS